jgi:hypothetical protein
MEEDARLLEFNCVAFSEQLIYGDLMTPEAAPSTQSP